MSVTRTLLVSLLLGACSHGHAGSTASHSDDRTAGSIARREEIREQRVTASRRARREPTAMDQGESPADLEITRGIRAAVVHDASLSFGARNVVIITQSRSVTLRGNVTREERAMIEAHARAIAGAGHVTDDLTIVP